MGEEITRKPVQSPGQNQGSADPRPGTGTRPGQAAGNSPAPAPGTGRTAPARTPARPGTGTETQEKPATVLSVSEDKSQTAPAPEPPKKKQTRTKKPKKKEQTEFSADQISALILSASAIIGSRPGLEVWTLRPDEATQLANPIANMIEKSEKLKAMSEHADAISLVTASLVIFAPRMLIYNDQQKKKKLEQTGGVKIVHEKGKSAGGVERPSKPSPSNGPKPGFSALDAISPLI